MATLEPDQGPPPNSDPWQIKPEAVASLPMEKQFQFYQNCQLLEKCVDAKDIDQLFKATRYYLLSFLSIQEHARRMMAQQIGIE